jgi:hypothetical protein
VRNLYELLFGREKRGYLGMQSVNAKRLAHIPIYSMIRVRIFYTPAGLCCLIEILIVTIKDKT